MKTIKRVRKRGDIAIIFITHNEIHSRRVGDRYKFLALGNSTGTGTADQISAHEMGRLMSSGTDMGDRKEELAKIK